MRTGSRGIVLVAVLWALAILTVCATVVVTRSVESRNHLDRFIQTESAKSAADGAIRLMMLKAASAAADVGEESILMPGGGDAKHHKVAIELQMESGRVDLNAASAAVIAGVLEESGWRPGPAQALAEEVLRRRSSTPAPRTYAPAGTSAQRLITQGPLQSISELRALSPTLAIGDEVLDSFTIYTHAPEPNLMFASEAVRRTLLRTRDAAASPRAAPVSKPQLIGEVVRIKACIDEDDLAVCRVAIGRLTGNSSQLAQIFVWYTQWPWLQD